jgi:hypothetical protein
VKRTPIDTVCQAPNKQLQRTVIPNRWRGASASFHYALAPRFKRQRAAAELRRYTVAVAYGSFARESRAEISASSCPNVRPSSLLRRRNPSRTSREFCQRSGSALERDGESVVAEWALAKRAVSGRAALSASVRSRTQEPSRVGGSSSVGRTLWRHRIGITSSCSGRVMHKVPRHIRQRAAAELRRYTVTVARGSFGRES